MELLSRIFKINANTVRLLFLCVLLSFLQSCASSNITREANDNAVVGVQRTSENFRGVGGTSVADSYGNTNQTVRGAIIGGATGAVVGGLVSGVGVIPGLAEGAILGGAYGAYVDSHTTLEDKLINRGVKIIELGDQRMIVLHSNGLFNATTAVVRPGAYSTLDLIATYLNTLTTMTVKVSAYTSDKGDPAINLALSKEQAESIVRYFWRSGVNTRIMTASGMGGNNLVEPDSSRWDSFNYRIEITTEQFPTKGTLG